MGCSSGVINKSDKIHYFYQTVSKGVHLDVFPEGEVIFCLESVKQFFVEVFGFHVSRRLVFFLAPLLKINPSQVFCLGNSDKMVYGTVSLLKFELVKYLK